MDISTHGRGDHYNKVVIVMAGNGNTPHTQGGEGK